MTNSHLRAATTLVAIILACGIDAHGEELFLKPDKTVISIHSEPLMRPLDESFHRSEQPLSRESVLVSVLGRGRTSHPGAHAWYDESECITTLIATTCGRVDRRAVPAGAAAILKYRVAEAGTYVVGVSIRPQVVTISPATLTTHLEQAGANDLIVAMKSKNDAAQVRERRARYARAIVQVLDRASNDFVRPLGHAVEILLDQNPYKHRVGDSLSFRVLYDELPLANQLVNVGYSHSSSPRSGGRVDVRELTTDANGRASFIPSVRALWYIAVAHMQASRDPLADYDATWATVTFWMR